jgi:hypothetical protein
MFGLDCENGYTEVKCRAPRVASFSIIGGSAGNDAAASFQRTGYQGCRISPPDLAIVSWP